MYLIITLLFVVFGQNLVRGDFINPLNYVRCERAVTQLGECLILCGRE